MSSQIWAGFWLGAWIASCCSSSSTVFSPVHKKVPDVAMMGVWGMKSTLFLHPWACHFASDHSWIMEISRMGSSMHGFTSWAPGELPFPLTTVELRLPIVDTCWGIWSLQNCSAVSAACSCSRVSWCPSVNSQSSPISRDHSPGALPWLTILHLFKHVFSLLCHLAYPPILLFLKIHFHIYNFYLNCIILLMWSDP